MATPLTARALLVLALLGTGCSSGCKEDYTSPYFYEIDGHPRCEYEPSGMGFGLGKVTVRAEYERADVDYEMTVVKRIRDDEGLEPEVVLRLEAELWARREGVEYVEIRIPERYAARLWLPEGGERALVRGGGFTNVDSGQYGYVRLVNLDGELFFEGGDPAQPYQLDSPIWEDKLLTTQPRVPEAEPCWPDDYQIGIECSELRWEEDVVLHHDGDEVLAVEEERELELEGDRYFAISQGAFHWVPPACGDLPQQPGLHYASAFVGRINDGEPQTWDYDPNACVMTPGTCPTEQPTYHAPCSATFEEPCWYDIAEGCVALWDCWDCEWVRTSYGSLEFCPGDERSCRDSDEGCPEGKACLPCACEEEELWRCIGDEMDCASFCS